MPFTGVTEAPVTSGVSEVPGFINTKDLVDEALLARPCSGGDNIIDTRCDKDAKPMKFMEGRTSASTNLAVRGFNRTWRGTNVVSNVVPRVVPPCT
jgi:hypothetical protein